MGDLVSIQNDFSASATWTNKLRALSNIDPLYFLPADFFGEEVLIPGFKNATSVDCMAGFFSSRILASLAPGLATYINANKEQFRLVISPLLQPEDKMAIEEGIKDTQTAITDFFENVYVTEDMFEQHTLKCLSWLLRKGQIEIKIALMKDALFHPKVWLFRSGEDVLAAHGSSNMTYAGIQKNIEQVAISKSWEDPTQNRVATKFGDQFEKLWHNEDKNCIVVDLPKAVHDRLLHSYNCDHPPTEQDLRTLYNRVSEPLEPYVIPKVSRRRFEIPPHLQFTEGPFAHQGKAVTAWCDSNYQGVLEMATGSGKTITAMICAYKLYEMQKKPLLIVVAAPYVPLIQQWCDEIAPFGIVPINLTTMRGAAKRGKVLQKLKRRLRAGLSSVETVVVSHDTLCTPEFKKAVESFGTERLLIADEAHNLGRPEFINDLPEFFEHRLGLSATPIRQYDEEGTEALFGFFGPVIFRFTLEEAIGYCLVEYDYYVHPVYLTENEMDEWFDLTGRIKKNAYRLGGEGKPDDYLAKLLRDRRALLETASGKVAMLARLLDADDIPGLRHTLVYTSDKGPKQLKDVNRLLMDRRILFHQLTAEETKNREGTKRIIKSFQDGDIQVLTAKRVLDEGVNIPQICKAFILASTTVERQWIQRRGRLLRTCSDINKTHSVIHDLITLPPNMEAGLDPDARALVRSELYRTQEFARLARNAGRSNGPLSMIDRMVDAAYL